ncbi:hypothetical protein CLOSTASPAR_04985 [[Clostridium] asparagiforme DSM 15981]|uniref:Uncharacterized protein n=1 Tax=[Clostridium] asparagiforme DSM 15981 TaxID=518636 RepID=C0D6T7_9FIRM|nr:hypothetical protein CLOSTASPAR_04985 [[Clostridium] asparagiforme DSM 15981]
MPKTHRISERPLRQHIPNKMLIIFILKNIENYFNNAIMKLT